jgi:hypothetical protein
MAVVVEEDKWTTAIRQLSKEGRLASHQCKVYNKDSQARTPDEKCGCQRSIRHHSFDGTPLKRKPKPEDWNVKNHTEKLPSLIYHSTVSRKVSSLNSFFFDKTMRYIYRDII